MFSDNSDGIEAQEPVSLDDRELTAIQRLMAGAAARTFHHDDWIVTVTKTTLLTGFELRLVLFNQSNGTRYLYCYDEQGHIFHCEGVRYPLRKTIANPADPISGYTVPNIIGVDQTLPKTIIEKLDSPERPSAAAA